MSEQSVRQVIGRATTDAQFRKRVASNAQNALVGYDLTDGERATLKGMPYASTPWWGRSTMALRYRRMHKAAWAAAYRACLREAHPPSKG